MKRLIIRHLSGSKAHQEEIFPLDGTQPLTLGRDATFSIRFDEARDDSVSRTHARIEGDAQQPDKLFISDAGSRKAMRAALRSADSPGSFRGIQSAHRDPPSCQ
jgi:hypothetical protein